jgi:hypothetical protein
MCSVDLEESMQSVENNQCRFQLMKNEYFSWRLVEPFYACLVRKHKSGVILEKRIFIEDRN